MVIGGKLNVLENVEQRLVFCSEEEGKMLELEQIVSGGQLRLPCLIFAQSRRRVRQIYRELKKWEIMADYLDAGLSLEQRKRKIEEFEQGLFLVLITTDVLARGIDIRGLRMVINFDVPASCVTYVHRVGRTGRAGESGSAITFYTPLDQAMVRKLAEMLKQSGCKVDDWLLKLKLPSKRQLQQFAKSSSKREDINAR